MANQSVMKNHTGSVSVLPRMMPQVCGNRAAFGTAEDATRGRAGTRTIAEDQIAFLSVSVSSGAFGRWYRKRNSGSHSKSESAGDQEGRSPASERVINAEDEKRRDGRANRGAAVEQGHGPAALPAREPFGDGLRGAGQFAASPGRAGTERSEAPQAGRS